MFFFWNEKKIWKVSYVLFILLLQIGSLVHELPSIKYWEQNANGLHGLIVRLDTFSWWFTYYFNYFLTLCRNKKILRAVEELKNFDVTIPVKRQEKLFKMNVAHVFVNVAFIVAYNVLGHDWVWPNDNHTPVTSSLYIFGDLTMFLSSLIFFQLTNLISETFKYINERLIKIKPKDMIESKSNFFGFYTREIIKLRQAHLFLINIAKDINSHYSEQVL